MFRQSSYSYSRELAEIERRMQALERQFERLSVAATRAASGGAASVSQAADRITDALAPALDAVLDRFRGGARSVGGEARGSAERALRA